MISEHNARRRVAQWCLEATEGHALTDVASSLGVRWATVKAWTTGEAAPSSVHLLRLANYCRYPLEEMDP